MTLHRFELTIIAAALLATLSLAQPAYAAQAAAEDRARMALAVGDYLDTLPQDATGYSRSTSFRLALELGSAAVQRPWALATWRSNDQSQNGLILFKYFYNKWNVLDISMAMPAQTQRLTARGVPASTAAKLVAEISAFGVRDSSWDYVQFYELETYRPMYLAIDYDKPGHPALTTKETARIRKVLALVKPCQRVLVRYVFPQNSSFLPFVLFFQGPGYAQHVFGQSGNTFYDEGQGTVHAFPYDSSEAPTSDIKYDIARTPCSS